MGKVTIIPQKINPVTRIAHDVIKKRRVAAYARVSTDSDEQATSYEAQVNYYSNFIKDKPNWEYVDVYSDEGILLGKVDDIFNNGSCDIYVVKDELGKQLLLPAISDVIKEINLDERKIVVHILKGLI